MGMVIQLMNMALQNLIPPPNADEATQYMHRIRVTIVACSAFVGLIAFVALSMGCFPNIFPGFARADQLLKDHNESRLHWSYEAEDAIMSMRVQQCRMPSGEAKDIYAATIQKRMADYFELTHQQYPLAACEDL